MEIRLGRVHHPGRWAPGTPELRGLESYLSALELLLGDVSSDSEKGVLLNRIGEEGQRASSRGGEHLVMPGTPPAAWHMDPC